MTVEPEHPVAVADLIRFEGIPHFLSLELKDRDGNPVADNFYTLAAADNEYNWKKSNWYITPITRYADLSFVFKNKADVTAEVLFNGKTCYVTVVNHSDVLAPMLICKAKDLKGNLVVPAWWSDNFFPLLPHETRTVTCLGDGSIVNVEVLQ